MNSPNVIKLTNYINNICGLFLCATSLIVSALNSGISTNIKVFFNCNVIHKLHKYEVYLFDQQAG